MNKYRIKEEYKCPDCENLRKELEKIDIRSFLHTHIQDTCTADVIGDLIEALEKRVEHFEMFNKPILDIYKDEPDIYKMKMNHHKSIEEK